MISEIRLEVPNKDHKQRAIEFIREFSGNNSSYTCAGKLEKYIDNYDDWLLKLKADLDIKNLESGIVPESTYFAVRTIDNRIVGMINIRHQLNDWLLKHGGQIGYGVSPSERRKGYATSILSLGLKRCRELGMNKVLICCDKSNIGSYKTIISNGGVLENEIYDSPLADVVQRYWINL